MIYMNTSLNWEEFFIQEALELEEKMKNIEMDSLNKSKIRLCLEHKLIDWSNYENWIINQLGCCSLKPDFNLALLEQFIPPAKQALDVYSNYKFWNEDLMPFFIWDNQLIVLSLQYSPQMLTIPNHILIIAPPEILTFLFQKIMHNPEQKTNSENTSVSQSKNETELDLTKSILDGVFLDIAAPSINFSSVAQNNLDKTQVTNDAPQTASAQQNPVQAIWEFIAERQEEYAFEARKQFDAFIILSAHQNKTHVFKMDADLEKEGISNLIFEYSLQDKNPFQKVYESGISESFSLTQLDINLPSYRYACITPLKRGTLIVGFLMGLKKDHLSEKDQVTLQELALEAS